MNPSSSPAEKKTSQSRQRAGAACEECRRRKLRCDGKQPQCEPCFEAGVQCVTPTNHPQRGPKRGHLKALQTRMGSASRRHIKSLDCGANVFFAAMLEQRLLEQQQNGVTPSVPCVNLMEGLPMNTVLDLDQSLTLPVTLPAPSTIPPSLSDLNSETHPAVLHRPSDMSVQKSLDSPSEFYISDLLRVDL